MNLVYNSDILPVAAFSLAPTNRAFQYGDGLFETIRYQDKKIWFWPHHYARLRAGMNALQLNVPDPFGADDLHSMMLALLTQNGLTPGPARLKLQVWRGPGGLYTPTTHTAHWLLTASPTQPFAVTHKPNLGFFSDLRLYPSVVSPYKTLNALPYVLAGLYRQQRQLDEVVLLDTHGHLAECVASSLFWVKAGLLHTPSLETGCINGIIRQQLIRTWPVQEGLFLPAVLNTAEAVFCANVNGIQTLLGTLPADVQPFTDRLLGGRGVRSPT